MSADPASAIAIERVAETGSTNADLLAWARQAGAGLRPRVLVAERQTAGRGRQGRRWHATPGASLTFSLAWPLACADLSGLSLAVGVALAEAIDPAPGGPLRVGLKWPNDLWLVAADGPGRKLGGVLIETAPHDGGRVAVIGIGLNVLAQTVDDASSGVAWLAEIEPGATPAGLLDRLVPALAEALARFDRDGFAGFAARFAARDLLLGRPVRCGADGAAGVEGTAAGVTGSGELLVRTPEGLARIGSGEVSVRPLAPGIIAARERRPAGTPC